MRNSNLFKAKRIDNGEWVIGNLIVTPNADKEYQAIIIPSLTSDMYTVGKKDLGLDLGFETWYKVDPDTICKCVGIEDKTENLLFENDIIEKEFYTDCDAYANSEKYVGVLKWSDALCSWDICTSKCNIELSKELEFTPFASHFKVIGNVFDNPELLEEFHIPFKTEIPDEIEEEFGNR